MVFVSLYKMTVFVCIRPILTMKCQERIGPTGQARKEIKPAPKRPKFYFI